MGMEQGYAYFIDKYLVRYKLILVKKYDYNKKC